MTSPNIMPIIETTDQTINQFDIVCHNVRACFRTTRTAANEWANNHEQSTSVLENFIAVNQSINQSNNQSNNLSMLPSLMKLRKQFNEIMEKFESNVVSMIDAEHQGYQIINQSINQSSSCQCTLSNIQPNSVEESNTDAFVVYCIYCHPDQSINQSINQYMTFLNVYRHCYEQEYQIKQSINQLINQTVDSILDGSNVIHQNNNHSNNQTINQSINQFERPLIIWLTQPMLHDQSINQVNADWALDEEARKSMKKSKKTNQSNKQSNDQSNNQPNKQSANQSNDPSNKQSNNQTTKQSNNQSNNQSKSAAKSGKKSKESKKEDDFDFDDLDFSTPPKASGKKSKNKKK